MGQREAAVTTHALPIDEAVATCVGKRFRHIVFERSNEVSTDLVKSRRALAAQKRAVDGVDDVGLTDHPIEATVFGTALR